MSRSVSFELKTYLAYLAYFSSSVSFESINVKILLQSHLLSHLLFRESVVFISSIVSLEAQRNTRTNIQYSQFRSPTQHMHQHLTPLICSGPADSPE